MRCTLEDDATESEYDSREGSLKYVLADSDFVLLGGDRINWGVNRPSDCHTPLSTLSAPIGVPELFAVPVAPPLLPLLPLMPLLLLLTLCALWAPLPPLVVLKPLKQSFRTDTLKDSLGLRLDRKELLLSGYGEPLGVVCAAVSKFKLLAI